MKRTPLYDAHIALGARMVEFGGWEMPVQYSGILDEHHAVRTAAGLFDIDHMGQIVVTGADALAYLQHMATNDLARMQPNEANYGLLCYADGGVVDDIFTYNMPGRYFIAVNASNLEKDYKWLLAHTAGYDVKVENVSEATYMLALQGPHAEQILQKLTPVNLAAVKPHFAAEGGVLGVPTLIGRTGYTGEDGFELFFDAKQARKIWDGILDAGAPLGVKPIGLGARDSLRFESKMPLYGQEIGADITPIEAGLGWAVALNVAGKEKLIGRDALLKMRLEGPKRRLVGFEMVERGIPRHNYELAVNDQVVGHVTTGLYSPTLEKNIGLGYVPSEFSAKGTEIQVVIRGKFVKASIVPTPFYKRA